MAEPADNGYVMLWFIYYPSSMVFFMYVGFETKRPCHPQGLLIKLLTCVIALLMAGCAGEDKKSNNSNPTTDPGPQPIILSGLWVGEVEEQVGSATATLVPSHLLFHQSRVYILRTDEAQSGTYELIEEGHIRLDTDVYDYAAPDDDNLFYIGSDNGANLDLAALLVGDNQLVASYHTSARAGLLNLQLDTEQEDNLTFKALAGQWDTTDSETFFDSKGYYLGFDATTSCRWEGQASIVTASIMAITMLRENCDEFNGDSQGLALIDGDGSLHFVSEKSNAILWMRFEPATGTTTPDTETEDDAA